MPNDFGLCLSLLLTVSSLARFRMYVPDAAVGLSSSPSAVDVVRVDDNVVLLALVEVQDVVSVTFN